MRSNDFVSKLKKIATDYKTVYAWGMFGSPITKSVVSAKARQYPEWYDGRRLSYVFDPIISDGSSPTWGFDCVGLVKAVLWGWDANGGALYASNGVPDISADAMICRCTDTSEDFSSLTVGEFLWMKGHCGIYIGNGQVVESTPKWKNGVQITALSARKWLKHGKLPYVDYGAKPKTEGVNTVSIDLPILANGSEGNAVKALQRLLLSQGYDLGKYGADGDFGSKTSSAVKAYQKKNGLTADGVVGKNTWSKLLGVK